MMRGECGSVGEEANAREVGDGGHAVGVQSERYREYLVTFGIQHRRIDFEASTVRIGCGDVVTLEFLAAMGGEMAAGIDGEVPDVHAAVIAACEDGDVGVNHVD